MKLTNNSIVLIATLLLWQVVGLVLFKWVFFLMAGMALVAAHKNQLPDFLFSSEPASLQIYAKQMVRGVVLAVEKELQRRSEFIAYEESEPESEPKKRVPKLENYWYLDQYQIKEICGISKESSLVRSWKEKCDGDFLFPPHLSGAASSNQKLQYSVEALTHLGQENECLLPLISGECAFSYWYKNKGQWNKGSYSPID